MFSLCSHSSFTPSCNSTIFKHFAHFFLQTGPCKSGLCQCGQSICYGLGRKRKVVRTDLKAHFKSWYMVRSIRERIKIKASDRELDPRPVLVSGSKVTVQSVQPGPCHFISGMWRLNSGMRWDAYSRRVTLARVSLKPSTMQTAGYGVHLRQAVVAGQLLLK